MTNEYRVLLLEDDPADVELVRYELQKNGMNFILKHVDNKESFTKEIVDFKPNIILSDYNLPQYDGISALHHTKENYPHLPFILISGFLGDEKAVETLKMGAADYILKDRINRLYPSVIRALLDIEREKMEKELQARLQALEIQQTEMRQRELHITKLQQEIEKIKSDLISHDTQKEQTV